MDISIIIPVFNEAEKIAKDILEVENFVAANNLDGELIIVDDGSRDHTVKVVKQSRHTASIPLHIIELENNRGKGAAVREGLLSSKGDLVMYIDCGSAVPLDNALMGFTMIREGRCDFAFGSRKLPESSITKGQDFDRKIISKLFEKFAKATLKIPRTISDTQCGFKIYKGTLARKLFEQIRLNGFLFEIEFIQLAIKGGFSIMEFPVIWYCDRDSRLSITQNAREILVEIIALWFGKSGK